MQRLEVTFCRGEELKYLSHLDLIRLIERIFRRADLPVAYSQGFHPQPRMSLGAPLAVGLLTQADLLDIFLEQNLDPLDFVARLNNQMPPGLHIISAIERPEKTSSLMARMLSATYRATILTELDAPQLQERIAQTLEAQTLPRIRERGDGKSSKPYDLRPLILALSLEEVNTTTEYTTEFTQPVNLALLQMHLQNNSRATGRPDEVLAQLGLTEGLLRLERLSLVVLPPETKPSDNNDTNMETEQIGHPDLNQDSF